MSRLFSSLGSLSWRKPKDGLNDFLKKCHLEKIAQLLKDHRVEFLEDINSLTSEQFEQLGLNHVELERLSRFLKDKKELSRAAAAAETAASRAKVDSVSKEIGNASLDRKSGVVNTVGISSKDSSTVSAMSDSEHIRSTNRPGSADTIESFPTKDLFDKRQGSKSSKNGAAAQVEDTDILVREEESARQRRQRNKSLSSPNVMMEQHHDIFISFRFHEAMDQAKEMKQKLNVRGVTTFVCNNVSAGESIKELVIEKLDKASLVIVLGTETYGEGTVNFSTKEEMEFILSEKKPYFLVKMCRAFKVARTRFNFSEEVACELWPREDDMPQDLIEKIIAKLNTVKSLDSDLDAVVKSNEWTKGNIIGQGATSHVFHAIWNKNGQHIAVKEMIFSREHGSEVKKLLKEVNIMRQLSHPNIVKYLGFDDSKIKGDCTAYIFCELVSGGSLDKMISEFGALDEKVVQRYTRETLEGLIYLHSQKPPVVHRDIKPANVLVTNGGVAKLADFGASKFQANINGTVSEEMMTLAGTPYFMSPEACQQVHVGRRSDVWSFGGMVLNMATGVPPWRLLGLRGHLQLFDEILHGTRFKYSTPLEVYQAKRNPDEHPKLQALLVTFLERTFMRDYSSRPYSEILKQDIYISGSPSPSRPYSEALKQDPHISAPPSTRRQKNPYSSKKKQAGPVLKTDIPSEQTSSSTVSGEAVSSPPASGFSDLSSSENDEVNIASLPPQSPPPEPEKNSKKQEDEADSNDSRVQGGLEGKKREAAEAEVEKARMLSKEKAKQKEATEAAAAKQQKKLHEKTHIGIDDAVQLGFIDATKYHFLSTRGDILLEVSAMELEEKRKGGD